MTGRIPAFLFLLLFFPPVSLIAQINRGSADFFVMTSYKVAGVSDSVFIFYNDNPDKYIQAFSPNGDSATFDWSYYDDGTGDYVALSSEYDTVSRIAISESNGYRVLITGNGNNYEGRCWAVINDFSVEIYNGDTIDWEGTERRVVPQSHKWCHLIRDIRARVDSADLYYYDPFADTLCTLGIEYSDTRSNWSANPYVSEPGINHYFQNDEYYLEIDIEDPYWEDTWYIITITDNYEMSQSDSIFYETIEPHADYTYQYIRLNDSAYYPGRIDRYYDDFYGNDDNISAPAQFLFQNLSSNADTLTWIFGDSLIEHTHADSILHTYHLPGSYYPKLIAYNIVEHLYETCVDTFPKTDDEYTDDEYPIIVEESAITPKASLPNVFSCPDGESNYFRFIGDVSISFFEIAIYNRYGKRVYHYQGNIRDWEGWDGMDKNSDNYVYTGVYYYVVKEIRTLPDFETGRKPKISEDDDSQGGTTNPDDSTSGSNTIYKGFVHVYNTQY